MLSTYLESAATSLFDSGFKLASIFFGFLSVCCVPFAFALFL